MKKHETREQWLQAAVGLMKSTFESAGYKVPEIRVSCGWPSSRALSAKKRCLGEAWSRKASIDGVPQIFISPWLVRPADPQGVLPTLIHEVCHAVVGNEQKHNKVFGKCARGVGLEGKLTMTHAGAKLVESCKAWSAALGEYPHARLDLTKRPTKKQTTRMVKMECSQCGYVARTSRKWLDEVGPCICPAHKKPMSFEIPDELEDDED